METFVTDFLCIGAGLAGERTAIEAASAGFDVICLSLVPARRSHSSAAQGGMQAALGNCAMGRGDSPDVHFEDTVKGSDWGCDQEVARLFCDNAPIAMRQMAFWGVPWNRVVAGKSHYFKGGEKFEKEELKEKEGLITARSFGGTAKWRTCYTSDGTGHTVLYTMDNVAASLGVKVHDKVEAIALVHDGTTCTGAVCRCLKTGNLRVYLAKATMIATGGFGRIYRESTNAVINDGGGHIIALDTGVAPLGNMEAVQFHPTGIVPTYILVTEGCRGDGGTLLDVNQERFMHIYEPAKAELASRDVVSRWMVHHIREGKGVKSPYGDHLWLDIRHLGEQHIRTKLREVDEICQNFLGVDPVTGLIPVRPVQHYSMGGVRTDKDGAAYGLKGLFSAGEAA
ncbi:MAG: fumarate reductase flavoprotein subunit, partial [Thermodesulfobacteriota bacterium]